MAERTYRSTVPLSESQQTEVSYLWRLDVLNTNDGSSRWHYVVPAGLVLDGIITDDSSVYLGFSVADSLQKTSPSEPTQIFQLQRSTGNLIKISTIGDDSGPKQGYNTTIFALPEDDT